MRWCFFLFAGWICFTKLFYSFHNVGVLFSAPNVSLDTYINFWILDFFPQPLKSGNTVFFFLVHSPMATSLWVAVTTIKKDSPGLRATKSLWSSRYPLSDALTGSPDQLQRKCFTAQTLEGSGLCPLQVSVLTDQVEAQGEKIRDLDLCLDEHREKLNATEEMLQQVCSPPCVDVAA